MTEYNALHPIYSSHLDTWGFCEGTRLWTASGSHVPAEQVREGDYLFGITFRLEDEYVGRSGSGDPLDNIVQVMRPVLCARRVVRVELARARAWQLTFGDAQKSYEARRLVCGGDTVVSLFPLSHEIVSSKRVVDLYTAVPNPRVGSEERHAMVLDPEWSEQEGRPMYRPTPFTGQTRGDHVTLIPYEHLGGQLGLFRSDIRSYNRYLFTQAREVVPLLEEARLYQIYVQGDPEDAYDGAPRRNLIAQTPFAPEKRRRRILTDHLAAEVAAVRDPERFRQEWDAWAEQYRTSRRSSVHNEIVSTTQGMFYDSQNDPVKAKALADWYGIRGGWLDGGILVDVPALP